MVTFTTEMSPDEYMHYVLEYCAVQSGLAEHSMSQSLQDHEATRFDVIHTSYHAMFDRLMDRLNELSDDQRVNSLTYMGEQIERFDHRWSSAEAGKRTALGDTFA